jgi:hypothetical protein
MEYKYIEQTVKKLIKVKKQRDSVSNKFGSASLGDLTPRKRGNLSCDLAYLCHDIEMLEHELHCRIVECGFAERSESRYKTVDRNVDGWSSRKVTYREPDKERFEKWELVYGKTTR